MKYCRRNSIQRAWGNRMCISFSKSDYSTSFITLLMCVHGELYIYSCCNCKWYLPSFVSPSSCTVLLLWCLCITTCTMEWAYFREKSNKFTQKGVWAYFWGWAYFQEIIVRQLSSTHRTKLILLFYRRIVISPLDLRGDDNSIMQDSVLVGFLPQGTLSI